MVKQWVEIYIDETTDSWDALRLLQDKGYRVITFPVRGNFGPELRMDSDTGQKVYLGLEEIKAVIR